MTVFTKSLKWKKLPWTMSPHCLLSNQTSVGRNLAWIKLEATTDKVTLYDAFWWKYLEWVPCENNSSWIVKRWNLPTGQLRDPFDPAYSEDDLSGFILAAEIYRAEYPHLHTTTLVTPRNYRLQETDVAGEITFVALLREKTYAEHLTRTVLSNQEEQSLL